MQELKDVFNYLDRNKEGFIELTDLGTALRCIGLFPTECEVQELQEEAKQTNERISFEEFERLVNKSKASFVTNKEEVLKFFKSLEKSSDGFVDTKELKIALCNAGEPLQEKDVDSVYQDFGVTEDGKIKINDLVEGLFRSK
jgi:Ca2+-binding protein (EF-Hand superfamily)